MLKTHFILILICSCLFACRDNNDNVGEQRLPETVSYNFHIRPILSDKCFACHGPDARTRKAGLRLDVRDGAIAELQESPGKHAIVPGAAARSELFHRIVSADPDFRMPSKASNKTLSALEKAMLVRWIEQGAEYKPHWAFIKPVKVKPPTVSATLVNE